MLFSQVPHPLINEKFICQYALYLCMLTPLYSVIDRAKSMKSISSCYYMEIRKIHSWQYEPLQLMSHSEKAKGDYALLSVLSNIL